MKIYLASSWKNKKTVDHVAKELSNLGHEVDNFTDPFSGKFVFSWTELPQEILQDLNANTFLKDWRTQKAFEQDKEKIDRADAVVMIMPCGRSSHLELGYAAGKGKKTIIYYPGGFVKGEFETMYGFANVVTSCIEDIQMELESHVDEKRRFVDGLVGIRKKNKP